MMHKAAFALLLFSAGVALVVTTPVDINSENSLDLLKESPAEDTKQKNNAEEEKYDDQLHYEEADNADLSTKEDAKMDAVKHDEEVVDEEQDPASKMEDEAESANVLDDEVQSEDSYAYREKRARRYKSLGRGKRCQTASVYTYTGKRSCDGWKGISLEACKAKCNNNEVPNSSCPKSAKKKCAYVHYNRNWGCHLADKTCKPRGGASKYELYKKPAPPKIHYTRYSVYQRGWKCSRSNSVYTYTGRKSCDGWKGISLEDCKVKCELNELPNSDCLLARRSHRCKYVYYNESWGCHLANEDCKPINAGVASKYSLLRKEEKRGK